MTDCFSKIKQQDIKMTNDITIDCSTATLNSDLTTLTWMH